jgi:hypothetical protein
VQPGPLLPRREVDVGLGPATRPDVLVVEPVEAGAAQPVLPGELAGVLDPQSALLRRVDEEQPAEGPVRLTAEVLLGLLVDEDHPPTGVDQFATGDEPGQPGPDHDRICIERHARTS